jgi:16S rRNA (cytosine967-C5)-methyltransferase
MTAPARVVAYHALSAIDDGAQDLATAISQGRARLRDPRDRALASDIVHGTLRWRRTLDSLIATGTKDRRLPGDPRVLAILRLSLYQILYLDRVPASAVVDDAVDLARMAQRAHAAGFVNALLRGLLRQRHRLQVPQRPTGSDRGEALAYLGIAHSHPDWLLARWLDRFGFDAVESWVRFDNATPPLTVRANTLVGSRQALREWFAARGVETRPTTYAPDGLIVDDAPDRGLPDDPDGRWMIQDESSQLVTQMVHASPGERVLDLCAAPGAKTTALAADMHDEGVLVACDVRPRRLRILRGVLAHAGTRHTHVVHLDRDGPLPFRPPFDRILVDAPCSGLATIRRDPDIKWGRQESDLAAYAVIQRALLDRAAPHVAPGGRLIYATCSSEPDENDDVVAAFLDSHPDFERDIRLDGLAESVRPLVDDTGALRPLPHLHGLEAFYAASLVRNG